MKVLIGIQQQFKTKTKKMSEEFCQHNGKYTLDKDNKCCKCRLPLKKGIKGIRLPLNPNKDDD